MAVYVDDMLMDADVPNGDRTVSGRWSHLTADTEEELHAFAVGKLRMKRAWFQPQKFDADGRPRGRFHYDLVAGKRALALKLGAKALHYGSPEWMDVFDPTWREEPIMVRGMACRLAKEKAVAGCPDCGGKGVVANPSPPPDTTVGVTTYIPCPTCPILRAVVVPVAASIVANLKAWLAEAERECYAHQADEGTWEAIMVAHVVAATAPLLAVGAAMVATPETEPEPV